MAMPGTGCFVAWYDIRDGRAAEHDDWHTHEHMIERVAIPGFRRGCRYRSLSGSPRLCVIYQVDTLQVLGSPAYLDRLNHPTAWTLRSMPLIEGMNRTLCSVIASHGHGIGGYLATIQLSPEPDGAERLTDWLCTEKLPGLARRAGLCGAHLLVGDREVSQIKTQEKELRGGSDAVADWVFLVEGYDRTASEQALAELTGGSGLAAHGAGRSVTAGLFSLDYVIEEIEAKKAWKSA